MKKRLILLILIIIVLGGCSTKDNLPSLEEIVIISEPTIKEYYKGEELNLIGLKVEALYSDNTKEEINITMDNINGYNKNEVGEQNVIIKYNNKTTNFIVKVRELNKTNENAAKNDDFEYKEIDGGYEITNYVGNSKDVIIPSTYNDKPIISIGSEAFYLKELTSVEIPDSVTIIDSNAFEYNEISNIKLGNSVKTIESWAFYGNYIESIEIPNSVIEIGMKSFESNDIKSIKLGNSVTTIGDSAFSDNEITNIIIPDSVEFLGRGAFNYNELEEITIGSNVVIYNNFLAGTVVSPNNKFRNAYEESGLSEGTYIGTQEGEWRKE